MSIVLAWADIEGNRVTIHNLRNFDYRTGDRLHGRIGRAAAMISPRYVAPICSSPTWGSPWIAHPIVSFEFGGGDHVAFSIETRKEVGGGLFRLLGGLLPAI